MADPQVRRPGWTSSARSGCVGCGRCITWCPVGIDVAPSCCDRRPARRQPPSRAEPRRRCRSVRPNARASVLRLSRLARASSRDATENADTMTLACRLDPAIVAGLPGQFAMVALPGFSAAPDLHLALSTATASSSRSGRRPGDRRAHRTRVAATSSVSADRSAGAGRSRAAFGRDVVIVTGGIGLAPLRPLIDAILADRERFGRCASSMGRGRRRDQLFGEELDSWAGRGRYRGRADRRPRRARVARAGSGRHPPLRPGRPGTARRPWPSSAAPSG